MTDPDTNIVTDPEIPEALDPIDECELGTGD